MNQFDQYHAKLPADVEASICVKLFDPSASAAAQEQSREVLLLNTMREAYAYAKHFARKELDDGAVVSMAYEALTKAVKNFKPGHCRFFAYAKPYVRGAVCQRYRDQQMLPKLHQISLDGGSGHSAHPETGCTVDAEEEACLGTVEMDYEALHWRDLWAKLEPHLKTLTVKEQSVIADFRAGRNFREMGDIRGVSRAAMQSTFARALRKLRAKMMP